MLRYLELIRAWNCFMVALGVLVGALIVSPQIPFGVYLGMIAGFLITGAGNALNDYYDYPSDLINKPSRVLPSNRIPKQRAKWISYIMFLMGVGISFWINLSAAVIAGLNSGLLVFYGKYSKRISIGANLIVAYLLGSVFLFGAVSTAPDPFQIKFNPGLWLLILCSFLIGLELEIIKDIEDIPGDMAMNSNSLPIMIGPRKSRIVASFPTLAGIGMSPWIAHWLRNKSWYLGSFWIANLMFAAALLVSADKARKLISAGIGIVMIALLLSVY